jgi:hypothetical protein
MKAFKNSSMGFKVFELKFVITNLGVYVCACMNINTFLNQWLLYIRIAMSAFFQKTLVT